MKTILFCQPFVKGVVKYILKKNEEVKKIA